MWRRQCCRDCIKGLLNKVLEFVKRVPPSGKGSWRKLGASHPGA